MKGVNSSLFAKILCWFFLNLFLVGATMAIFFAFQPQLNLHALLGQQGWNRLRGAASLIVHDLYNAPRTKWSDILARHAGVHQVDFVLAFEDGTSVVSRTMDIPEDVGAWVKDILRKPFPGKRPPAPTPISNIDAMGDRPTFPLVKDRFVKKRAYPPEFKNEVGQLAGVAHQPQLMMRTSNPSLYWTGILLPPPPGSPDFSSPFVLLVVSDSVSGNGFFFDSLPWMLVAGAVLLISVLFWIPMIRNITRPLSRMTLATEEIARGHFDVALHEPRSDEIGRLARAINHMATRLAAFVKGQKRFLGDVSHELGSPIARIQFGLGALEQRVQEENRARVASVMEDVAHMSQLVGELLAFSRADMNAQAVVLEPVDLFCVAREAVRREMISGEEPVVDMHPTLRVMASPDLLTRALANLVRNAVKYAGDTRLIRIAAKQHRDTVILEVRDAGPGVPEEYLDQLFEPFFRPEPSRNRDSGGVGLGLAIVKTCIETCSGRVSARNLTPRGFAVTITLMAEG